MLYRIIIVCSEKISKVDGSRKLKIRKHFLFTLCDLSQDQAYNGVDPSIIESMQLSGVNANVRVLCIFGKAVPKYLVWYSIGYSHSCF
jgi:hypothetical protein